MRKYLCLGACVICAMFITTISMADIPPPEGYQETCTLDQQHCNDMDCITCDGGGAVDPADEGACDAEANEADGYEYVCSTAGASFNTEIWCKDSPGTEGPAGSCEEDENCSIAAVGAKHAGIGVFLLLGLALWSIRSIRKKR